MSKLLLAVGDKAPNSGTLDFACYLARLKSSRLTGIFLETLAHDELLVTGMRNERLHMQAMLYTGMEENGAVRTRCENLVRDFENACTRREVIGQAHRDRGMPWKELLTECRYADALIVDPGFSMDRDRLEASPTHDVKKLLHEAECPVIIAPPRFEQIDEIILTYDGSKSSVFAIRQFVHLFPELCDKKTVVLEIRPDEEDYIDNKYLLKEWLKDYVSDIEFVLLEGDSEDRLLEYLLVHYNAFVVMGGYGRGRLSRLFQPSTAAAVANLLPAPIFVAHL